MLKTLAIKNYRSLLDLTIPLGQLNLITGANGSGKSNLYRALRLLAETAQGGVVNAIAKEGGLNSTFWSGPEEISKAMREGRMPVQGTPRSAATRLKLGFVSELYSYSIAMGLPQPLANIFELDPEIKHECIWHGDNRRPSTTLVVRDGGLVKVRVNGRWEVAKTDTQYYDSLFSQIADPVNAPETLQLREAIRQWRFYDHFRTDADSPVRQPQLGTLTQVLHHDGHDLAAALKTIQWVGDSKALDQAVADAFPDSRLAIDEDKNGRLTIAFYQPGLLRPLTGAELSDGMLRYLLLVAALLTPRPPQLMVLNEPENSLHPDLLPSLARLIIRASQDTQVWVVSHAKPLINALRASEFCHSIELEKELGQTLVKGQEGLLSKPTWHWPDGK